MQRQGDGGAYVGGDWVPIEECAEKFLMKSTETSGKQYQSKCGKRCESCPSRRSCSSRTSARADGRYDVVVIGAGCIGGAVARELSKTKASVLILEAADDVTQGATKGNSGIVHAGFDDKPGSVRAKYCSKGCLMFPQLDRELHFGFQRNGSLVIAKSKEDEATLVKLLEQGKVNGVSNLRIIEQEELRRLEPNIHPGATQALLAQDAGTITPYEYAIALCENAVDNGVELRLRREVVGIEKQRDGFVITAKEWKPKTWGGKANNALRLACLLSGILLIVVAIIFMGTNVFAAMGLGVAGAAVILYGLVGTKKSSSSSIETPHSYSPSHGTVLTGLATTETIQCDYVVNCAGCHSDQIAKMVGDDSFLVNMRHGEYVLLDKKEGGKVSHTIFPAPGPLGKGVLVQATIWGNLILGPTARDTLRKNEAGQYVINEATRDESKESIMKYIFSKCAELVPSFNAGEVIHSFSGARAKTTRGDWIIEPCPTAPRMIHAAGIDSPGIAGSPAIAVDVVKLLAEAGCAPVKDRNPSFNAYRSPIILPKKGLKDVFGNKLKYGPAGSNTNPYENVVCKCEKVTEAEIVEAIRRSIPIDSTQAIRKRTRAGMGHCQADPENYGCEERVAAIIARELGIPISEVGRRPWPASSFLPEQHLSNAKATTREYVKSLQK